MIPAAEELANATKFVGDAFVPDSNVSALETEVLLKCSSVITAADLTALMRIIGCKNIEDHEENLIIMWGHVAKYFPIQEFSLGMFCVALVRWAKRYWNEDYRDVNIVQVIPALLTRSDTDVHFYKQYRSTEVKLAQLIQRDLLGVQIPRFKADESFNDWPSWQERNLTQAAAADIAAKTTASSSIELPENEEVVAKTLDHLETNIYSFTIQDKDPECLTFGCIAPSLEAAQAKARQAGYREFTLIDVRKPSGVELTEVANLELIANPLLGYEWLPLASALDSAISDMPVGARWSMGFMAHAYGFDESDAPYTQAILEADGVLHLEIGPPYLIEGSSPEQKDLLVFLGWEEPTVDGLPNFFRRFEPGWNPRYVAITFLQTLSLIFGITPEDLFTFSGRKVGKFDPDGLLDRLSTGDGRLQYGEAFGIFGLHPFPLKDETQDT